MTADPELLERLRAALDAGPPLRLAILFGSAATGALRPDSDVDVAILPEDAELPLAEELSLQVALTRAARRDADLVRLDRASTLLKWQVARDGVVLVARPAFAYSRFVASAVGEYLDFAPALAAATNRFRRRVLATRGPSK